MLAATVSGLGLGHWTVASVDGRLAGGVLMAWCLFAYANPNLHLPASWVRPLGPVSGFLTARSMGSLAVKLCLPCPI